jgi:hypothetical protein
VKRGNGWMGAGSASSAAFVRDSAPIRRFFKESQRDPATFGISKHVYLAVDNDKARAERRLRDWFERWQEII